MGSSATPFFQRTSDRYFVTEGLYGDPENNLVFREPLDFHHSRRPMQNQSELVGHVDRYGRHNLLFGYEFQRDKYRTDVTAGDDPDCLCGYWWLTIAPIDIATLRGDTAAARHRNRRAPDLRQRPNQCVLLAGPDRPLPQVKMNIAGRFDDYDRSVERVGGLPFTPQARDQTAYTYRAGVVYAPRYDQQLYVGTSSSFTPVTTRIPRTGRRWIPAPRATTRSVTAGRD